LLSADTAPEALAPACVRGGRVDRKKSTVEGGFHDEKKLNNADSCTGKVLDFDWKKAYADTGVKAEEHAPPDGPANPMVWVARAKMSRELARFPKEKLLSYIVELKPFTGKAALADRVAGADPYVVVWNQ
jgi:hypothetical protein